MKKGKFYTKKLLKITILDEQERSEVEEICIYQNLESGHLSIYLAIYIWK